MTTTLKTFDRERTGAAVVESHEGSRAARGLALASCEAASLGLRGAGQGLAFRRQVGVIPMRVVLSRSRRA